MSRSQVTCPQGMHRTSESLQRAGTVDPNGPRMRDQASLMVRWDWHQRMSALRLPPSRAVSRKRLALRSRGDSEPVTERDSAGLPSRFRRNPIRRSVLHLLFGAAAVVAPRSPPRPWEWPPTAACDLLDLTRWRPSLREDQ